MTDTANAQDIGIVKIFITYLFKPMMNLGMPLSLLTPTLISWMSVIKTTTKC